MNGELLEMLAEELRTGLASILGYSRTLEMRARRLTDEERVEFAGRISAHAERLARLADYLQTLARIDGTPSRQPADASAVTSAVAAELDEVIRAHGVTAELSLAPTLPVAANQDALQQMVASLVLAALQFTSDGSRLRIATFPSRGHGVVEIVATAARAEARARLKDLAAAQGEQAGAWKPAPGTWTALGPASELDLSLVRHLVEAHGGSLTIDLAGEAMTACIEVPQPSGRGSDPAGTEGRRPDLNGPSDLTTPPLT